MGIPNFKYVGDIFSKVSWFKKYGEKLGFSNVQPMRPVIYIPLENYNLYH